VEITKQAEARAKEIEAACWTHLHRPGNEAYNMVMMAKTRQVCFALIRNVIGSDVISSSLQLLLNGPPPVHPVSRWDAPVPRPRAPMFPGTVERPEISSEAGDLPSHYDAFPTFANDMPRDSGPGTMQMFDSPQQPFFKFDM
jgi:hypothetical protein